MKKIAILANPQRGKEIIDVLVALGGNNKGYVGDITNYDDQYQCYYIINDDNDISLEFFGESFSPIVNLAEYTRLTIEEFDELYPYRVNDIVRVVHYFGVHQTTITKMVWDKANEMVYYYVEGDEFPVYADKIICKVNNPVKEEKEQGEKMREQEDIDTYFQATSIKSICDCNAIKELLETKNRCLPHRIIIDTDKGITYHDFTIWLRNKQMPSTYDECCEIMGVNPDIDSQYCSGYIGDDLMELQDLIVCRDAYWKMCNNWQPNWNDNEYKYCIWCNHDEISTFNTISEQNLLAFPTEDIRDLFLKNFQRKIKICKRYI